LTLSKEIFVYYQYITKYGLFLRGGKYILKSTQFTPKCFGIMVGAKPRTLSKRFRDLRHAPENISVFKKFITNNQ